MPPLPPTPAPIEAAVAAFARRTGVASPLRSAGWAEMAVGLRQQAFWSAGVEYARFLSAAQGKLLSAIKDEKVRLDNGKTVNMDRSRFVRDMRRLVLGARDAGELPPGTGKTALTDIGDATRLRLIYDMNTRMAQGEARWRRQQDPDVLNMWPAQELMSSSAAHPREDWLDRWLKAAQDSGDSLAGTLADESGRLVALKTSGIWVALSRFGVPWPPFDYGSQRRLRNLTRAEAIELGLLEADQELDPVEEQFDRDLQASAQNITPEVRQAMQSVFGGQIEVDGDTVRWSPEPDAAPAAEIAAQPPEDGGNRVTLRILDPDGNIVRRITAPRSSWNIVGTAAARKEGAGYTYRMEAA
jgi:hypothetical protein